MLVEEDVECLSVMVLLVLKSVNHLNQLIRVVIQFFILSVQDSSLFFKSPDCVIRVVLENLHFLVEVDCELVGLVHLVDLSLVLLFHSLAL